MRNYLLFLIILPLMGSAQIDSTGKDLPTHRIVKTDGIVIVGKVISQDQREMLLRTETGREMYIPQHLIEKVEELEKGDFNVAGNYINPIDHPQQYYFTMNGVPGNKGEWTIKPGLIMAEGTVALTERTSASLHTTYVASPVVLSLQHSFGLEENVNLVLGTHYLIRSLIVPKNAAVWPFMGFTFGDEHQNVYVWGGYGGQLVGDFKPSAVGGFAFMLSLGPSVSLVSEGIGVILNENTLFYNLIKHDVFVITPGIRVKIRGRNSLQMGFSYYVVDGGTTKFPAPTFQAIAKF